MSRITFTEEERDLINTLPIRQGQILSKLAAIIGSGQLEGPHHAVAFDGLIGKGADEKDRKRIVAQLKSMREIVQKIYVDPDRIMIRFHDDALSLVRKYAMQAEEEEPRGNGVSVCEATLALKRAFGIRSDVMYDLCFDHENFNHGEDTSYLDTGFNRGDPWRMAFGDKPLDFLKREIELRPVLDGDIKISQTVTFDWPESDGSQTVELATVPMDDYTDPGTWEQMIPVIIEKGAIALEKARKAFLPLLEVRAGDGTLTDKAAVLAAMKAACGERDLLCDLFAFEPLVRQTPEWPLGLEPHGFFRECLCELDHLKNHLLDNFGGMSACVIQDYLDRLWLHLFRDTYGFGPDPQESSPRVEIILLRERQGERCLMLKDKYPAFLAQGEFRLAWGLHTRDFTEARAFVCGIIYHPSLGRKELQHMGWDSTKKLDREALRKCLLDAERLALLRT